MCARLGIRQAFSQAHRPQANCRAEAAGKQLITLLRKLNAEEGINWVEALPRALSYLHDMPGESGYSPYQVMFGRERTISTLQYTPDRFSLEAQEYFDHVEEVDRLVAAHLDAIHQKAQDRHNNKVKDRGSYQVGDKVWQIKPGQLGGNKLATP